MIKLGMLIADRYEIREKIGTGGMADVYKAKDTKLNRPVAIKVLKQEFSENTNFVSKFRVEAQATAGLLHPNIVNVYDVGDEGDIHYIVMELVEGITLKKYIEKKSRLTVKETISIAIQVAMGIEAAHNNHIIHRDIKPQNIIISKEGKVKVTDFGIAKAATSNTITSNVMGSVHYSSPEQARGGFSDEKSDVYSMGITMFEMLTGRVPFNGDTAVAIAIKHIQDQMPSPRDFVPDIPVSVEQIVLKCTQKSPDRRYQNMGDMIKDLKRSLVTPDSNFVDMDAEAVGHTRITKDEQSQELAQKDTPKQEVYAEPEDLGEIASRKSAAAKPAQSSKKSVSKKNAKTAAHKNKPKSVKKTTVKKKKEEPAYASGGVNRQNVRKLDYVQDTSYAKNSEYDYNPTAEHVTTALTVIAAIIIGCIVLYFAGQAAGVFGQTTTKESATEETEAATTVSTDVDGAKVPDVVGKIEAEGTAALQDEGYTVTKEEAYSSEYDKGTIISQSPEGDSVAARGSAVTIVISMGSEEAAPVSMPDVLGMSQEAAQAALEGYGLVLGTVTESYSSEYPAGQICYQSYVTGATISEGTVVDLKLSIGAETATYSCDLTIQAPSDYIGGNAEIILTTADTGEQLWYAQNVASFPVSIKLSGFSSTSAYGIVTISYLRSVEEVVTDADGNQTTQVNQELAQSQENVTFTKD